MLALIAVILSVPLFITFFETCLVPRVPTAILCTGLVLIAVLKGVSGLILDTVTRGRRELKRLAYLAHAAPRSASALGGQGGSWPCSSQTSDELRRAQPIGRAHVRTPVTNANIVRHSLL